MCDRDSLRMQLTPNNNYAAGVIEIPWNLDNFIAMQPWERRTAYQDFSETTGSILMPQDSKARPASSRTTQHLIDAAKDP